MIPFRISFSSSFCSFDSFYNSDDFSYLPPVPVDAAVLVPRLRYRADCEFASMQVYMSGRY